MILTINVPEFKIKNTADISDDQLITKLDFMLSILNGIYSLVNYRLINFDLMIIMSRPFIFIFLGLMDDSIAQEIKKEHWFIYLLRSAKERIRKNKIVQIRIKDIIRVTLKIGYLSR